jgi:hypothetical protein
LAVVAGAVRVGVEVVVAAAAFVASVFVVLERVLR